MENEKNLEEVQEEVTPVQEPVPTEEPATAVEETPAESAAEETASAEEAALAEETAEETAVQETPAEESKPEEKKATPGKMALVIGAIVVVAAVIIALLMGGKEAPPAGQTAPSTVPVETTEPVPTIPADGNPDDETCKGTYTVSDEEIVALRDTVVATIGDNTLTNGQLQTFYWMQVQSFLASEYGSTMMYYGMLDYTQPLDMQSSVMAEGRTWQQFFLKEALNSWQSYAALSEEAEAAGMILSEEDKAYLDGIGDGLAASAEAYGLASAEELLKHNVGAGAAVEDYAYCQELLIRGNKFYDAEIAAINPTAEEVKAFYEAHESSYAESGVTTEGKLVNVRHILFTPEGGTTDDAGVTTYSDAEWAACEAKAQDVMNAWTKGDCDEESFAAMANAYSQDPGSKTNGGLYENVQQGQMVPEFDSWCFDEKREPGHFGMVKTTYGYHMMYFVSSTPVWEYYSRQDLLAELTNTAMKEITEKYPMEVDYSAIALGLVNMAG